MIPEFQPQIAVGDYEKAPRNSFSAIFNFDWYVRLSVLVYKGKFKKGGKNTAVYCTYKKNSDLNEWMRFAMALPVFQLSLKNPKISLNFHFLQ